MLERINHISFIRGNTAAGIHIVVKTDGSYEIKYVLIKKKGSEISIIKKTENCNEIKKIVGSVPSSTPVCLSIEGKGIIHKKASVSDSESDQDILNKLLTNTSTNDFYVDRSPIDDHFAFISAIRMEILEEILTEIKENKHFVVDISLGPFSVNSVIGILTEKSEIISAGSYSLTVKNGKISDYTKTDLKEIPVLYRIGDENILENYLIPFSNALNYLIASEKPSSHSGLLQQRENFLYKKMFNLTGWLVLIILFAVLLVNFLYFDYYSKKQNDLSAEAGQNSELLNMLDTLTKELEMKDDFIKKSDFLSMTKHSFYADKLAKSVPDQILLTKMDLQPLEKKIKEGDQPIFQKNKIKISGIADDSSIFYDWIKKLNNENWILELEVLNYYRKDENKYGNFEIEISLKNQESII